GDTAIEIRRDEHGVRHVSASSERDLYRGLGFCHARDRGLQMLLTRIVGRGRAAELLADSDDMLRVDRFFRRLGLGDDAAAEVERIDTDTHALVEAYCDGVNHALRRRGPWELRLLGVRPEPWTAADSILCSRVAGYVALAQSQGDIERLFVEMVQAGVSRSHLDALFPGLLSELDEELLRRVSLGERVVPSALRWTSLVPRAVASNNWVVAGKKTASGYPILANDPHLEINRLPAVWYEIVLRLGERFCIAGTMPGLPGLPIGRTNDVAWGATYTFMDAIDSWIEECRDGKYRRDVPGRTEWHPFRARTEIIRRKKSPPVEVTFYENGHGVLDGDPQIEGLYLATRWATARGTGARSLAAMTQLMHAGDAKAAMELLGRIETAWNWVCADRRGAIGYQMSGCMPRRAPGKNGFVPLPGWDPANDWQGEVPAAELPREINPERGYIVTANEDLNHLGIAKPINMPMGSYRAGRIAAELAGRDDWTVETIHALQHDVYSPQAELFMPILLPCLPDTAAAGVLRGWDRCYDLESRGATLFERFYRALFAEVFGSACGAEVARFLLEETNTIADFYANFDAVLLDARSVWYGSAGRDALWRTVAAATLVDAARPWGEERRVNMGHLLYGGRLPRWLGFDRGPIALPGGRATVHQGQLYRAGGRATTFAPSYRIVTDFGENVAHTCLAGGPSDRRFSRWYASGLADWLARRLKPVIP
ncbi:MAG TPA: penicillin acylase family protein, partial [Candidatus Binatia bacterium]|nr:penicillin acylase family protein [Candidatus Binatia bacterium]